MVRFPRLVVESLFEDEHRDLPQEFTHTLLGGTLICVLTLKASQRVQSRW